MTNYVLITVGDDFPQPDNLHENGGCGFYLADRAKSDTENLQLARDNFESVQAKLRNQHYTEVIADLGCMKQNNQYTIDYSWKRLMDPTPEQVAEFQNHSSVIMMREADEEDEKFW